MVECDLGHELLNPRTGDWQPRTENWGCGTDFGHGGLDVQSVSLGSQDHPLFTPKRRTPWTVLEG
jgi:hypothetical protein